MEEDLTPSTSRGFSQIELFCESDARRAWKNRKESHVTEYEKKPSTYEFTRWLRAFSVILHNSERMKKGPKPSKDFS